VFAPLLRHATAASRVGVIGVGGLGHLALQYGRALGCEVTAFSSSSTKQDEAMRLGATDFVLTGSPSAITDRAGSYDLILVTAAGDLPWLEYLTALKPEGTLCVVGLPENEIRVHALPLLFGQRRVTGSLIGSPAETATMLQFSARHGIRPQIEVRPMHEANEALGRLRRNEVRYRTVLAT
jgi:alcohol/geraniol dehydrogenase (NADP+)